MEFYLSFDFPTSHFFLNYYGSAPLDEWNENGKPNLSALTNQTAIDFLRAAMTHSEIEFKESIQIDDGQFHSTPAVFDVHYYLQEKLTVSLPVYLMAFIALLFMYVNRRQQFLPLFKLSKMSKIIYGFFAYRLVFSLLYFFYLIAVVELGYEHRWLLGVFLGMTVLRVCVDSTPYFLLALISFGYGIRFFGLRNQKAVLVKLAAMTLLFTIVQINAIYEEYTYITTKVRYIDFTSHINMEVFEIIGATTRITSLLLLAFSLYKTYKGTDEYDLVKKSAVLLWVVHMTRTLVMFPGSHSFLRFFLHLFLLQENYGIPVPEIVDLFVAPGLMYMWRDIEGHYAAVDTEEEEVFTLKFQG